MKFKQYIEELKRRHVFKAGIAYLIVAWLIAQIASVVLPTFEAPPYIMKILLFLLFIGFPINLVISWVYDLTPDGIKKTKSLDEKSNLKNNQLNKIIISALVLAVVVLASNTFFKNVIPNKSIAVLAFADMSPDKDQEYFSDGITEELLNLISKTPDLRVISRTSSFSYKGKNMKVEDIGKELKVSHVLEGSVRKSGNTMRITAQLINISDGAHIWSEIYDRKLDDILKIQDEIAAKVTHKLQTTLGYIPTKKEVDPEAYTLYLKASHLVHSIKKESYINAEKLIKQSIAIDSTYAHSYRILSDIYYTGAYNLQMKPVDERIRLGIASAKKAIALDPEMPGAYANLGSLYMLDWNFVEAKKNMSKAIELAPGDAIILGTIALKQFGNVEETIRLINKAISLDPLVYTNYFNLGNYYFESGKLEEAEEAYKTFAIYYPNSAIYHYAMTKLLIAQGKTEEAWVEAQEEPNEFFSLYAKNFAAFASGRVEEADALLAEFIEKYGEGLTEAANIADIYAFRGDVEKAFFYLERAYQIKDPTIIEALNYPSFKVLHKDPRWAALILKMDFPKDHGYPMN